MGTPRALLGPEARIREALACVPADERGLWLRIGMAIKSALGEDGFDTWDSWSQKSASYSAADARTVWRSIDPDGRVKLGTLFFEASRYGYVHPSTAARDDTSPRSAETSMTAGERAENPLSQQCNTATLATYATWKKLP